VSQLAAGSRRDGRRRLGDLTIGEARRVSKKTLSWHLGSSVPPTNGPSGSVGTWDLDFSNDATFGFARSELAGEFL
jgi:hypothetical protein